MATEVEILKCLEELMQAYPNYTVPASTIPLYVKYLADVPVDALQLAVEGYVAGMMRDQAAFFPIVGELRNAAFDILDAASPLPSEYDAWAEVVARMQDTGHVRQPVFSHPLIARTVEQLGWRYLCLSEEPVADRAHFVKAYNSLAAQVRREQRNLPQIKAFIQAGREAAKRLAAGGEPASDDE